MVNLKQTYLYSKLLPPWSPNNELNNTAKVNKLHHCIFHPRSTPSSDVQLFNVSFSNIAFSVLCDTVFSTNLSHLPKTLKDYWKLSWSIVANSYSLSTMLKRLQFSILCAINEYCKLKIKVPPRVSYFAKLFMYGAPVVQSFTFAVLITFS